MCDDSIALELNNEATRPMELLDSRSHSSHSCHSAQPARTTETDGGYAGQGVKQLQGRYTVLGIAIDLPVLALTTDTMRLRADSLLANPTARTLRLRSIVNV